MKTISELIGEVETSLAALKEAGAHCTRLLHALKAAIVEEQQREIARAREIPGKSHATNRPLDLRDDAPRRYGDNLPQDDANLGRLS